MLKFIIALVAGLLIIGCRCSCSEDDRKPEAGIEDVQVEEPAIKQEYLIQKAKEGSVLASGNNYQLILRKTEEYLLSDGKKEELSTITFLSEAFNRNEIVEAEFIYDKIKEKTVLKLSNAKHNPVEQEVTYDAEIIEGNVLLSELKNVTLKIKVL